MNHPLLGEIVCVRSPRARRISISVRPSGAVRVTYPQGATERLALDFLESKVAWIVRTRERLAARLAAAPPALSPEEARSRREELRRAAKEDLPPRVERLAARSGLGYSQLGIRASRTRWGSCSGRNTISLSIYLVTLPEHLRDFVILHELCHTVHHDHSPRFHALLDRLTGGRERELARELRRWTIGG